MYAAIVVHPQHVVILGQHHRARHFQLEVLVHHVPDVVASLEVLAHRAPDDGIQLVLGIVFTGTNAELERNPEETGILPPLLLLQPGGLGDVHQPLEGVDDITPPLPGQSGVFGDPLGVAGHPDGDVLIHDVGRLALAQQPVVGEDDIVHEDAARGRAGRPPFGSTGALSHVPPRCGDGEGPIQFLVIDPDQFIEVLPVGEPR